MRAVPLRRRVSSLPRRPRNRSSPCLDQVSDPRNLGAVIRSAEGAGASGVVVPAHGSARVTAAVMHVPRPGPSSISRSPSSPPCALPEEIKGAISGSTGRWAVGRAPMWDADLSGGLALVFGAEGGAAAARSPRLRRQISIPLAGQVESLNVSVAAALLLYEARRRRASIEVTVSRPRSPARCRTYVPSTTGPLQKTCNSCGFACYVLPQLQGESSEHPALGRFRLFPPREIQGERHTARRKLSSTTKSVEKAQRELEDLQLVVKARNGSEAQPSTP